MEEAISKEHLKFVSELCGVDMETVKKVLEADIRYLDYVIGSVMEGEKVNGEK